MNSTCLRVAFLFLFCNRSQGLLALTSETEQERRQITVWFRERNSTPSSTQRAANHALISRTFQTSSTAPLDKRLGSYCCALHCLNCVGTFIASFAKTKFRTGFGSSRADTVSQLKKIISSQPKSEIIDNEIGRVKVKRSDPNRCLFQFSQPASQLRAPIDL
jgi:hypothetical protein